MRIEDIIGIICLVVAGIGFAFLMFIIYKNNNIQLKRDEFKDKLYKLMYSYYDLMLQYRMKKIGYIDEDIDDDIQDHNNQ